MIRLTYAQVAPSAALLHALLGGDERLTGLTARPVGFSGLAAAAQAAAAHPVDRAAVSMAVRERLANLGAPPESLAAAERLGEPGSVVVVAGQQPGLLGGAHLAVSKALTAVAVARRLARDHGVPAVPVFWNASEDHDHGEVDHVVVPGEGGVPERLRLPLPEDGRMLSRVAVPGGIEQVLERFEALLPDGPGRAEVLAVAGPQPGDDWGAWGSRLVLRLLGRFGLVVVEPHTLREFAAPVLRHEIEHPGALAATVADAEARLRAAGFDAPLALRRPEMFFMVTDGVRHRVRREGADFVCEDGGRLPAVDLLARLEREPEAFSWNVVTRILAQDAALPVAAQVCGPSELGYASLLATAHERLGLTQPSLLPRPGFTVLDAGTRRACDGLGVDPVEVVLRGEGAVPAAAPADDPHLAALRSAVRGLPEAAVPGVRRRRDAIDKAVGLYAAALERERATRDEVRSRRRARALGSLCPGGRLQERVCSVLPWVARYGTGLLDRVLEAMEPEAPGHVILEPGAQEASDG